MLKRVALILNPASGRGTGAKLRSSILERLSAGATVELFETERQGHARELTTAAQGFDVIAAAGGDGTLHEVVGALMGTEAAVGIIPIGTGNDVARHLGIGANWQAGVDAILNGESVDSDMGVMSTQGAERPFINIASCGFDAVVAKKINDGIRGLRGQAAYYAGILQTLATFKPIELTLTLDGDHKVTRKTTLCAIANASSYGAGLRVAPNAQIDDGLFDVVLAGDLSKIDFLRTFPKVFKGAHLDHPKVEVYQAKEVRLESAEPQFLNVDGEVFGETPATYRIVPKSIRLMRPKR